MQDLVLHLQALEERLFKTDLRTCRPELEKLISPDFREIGRSGRSYSYDQIMDALLTETNHGTVSADNYELQSLSETVALLTYRTTRTTDSGEVLHTLRSSIWRWEPGENWRMVFHQGTPMPNVANPTTSLRV